MFWFCFVLKMGTFHRTKMNSGACLSNIACMFLGLFSIVCIKFTALRFIFCHLSCNWIRHHSLWHLKQSEFCLQIIFQRRVFDAIDSIHVTVYAILFRQKWQMSMTRKWHNHKLQTNPRHREEETHVKTPTVT